jgi:CheY-like chemotaxis protein
MGQLFQPFVQLEGSLARQYEGTGLGLALVARLVDHHGGSVSVVSEPGSGSRFTVTLPWHAPPHHTPAQQPTAESALVSSSPGVATGPIGQAETLLLVEDNEQTVLMLSDYLRLKGYNVVIARSGSEAVAQALAHRPALILMDVQMPGMDGLTAIRQIRDDARVADVPIIALTALAMPGDRERCLTAGANEYLSKPISLKQLTQIITLYL